MPSSVNDESEEPAQSEVTAQLEAAQDEITKLKQLLDGARLEIVDLRKDVARKRFSIEVF